MKTERTIDELNGYRKANVLSHCLPGLDKIEDELLNHLSRPIVDPDRRTNSVNAIEYFVHITELI